MKTNKLQADNLPQLAAIQLCSSTNIEQNIESISTQLCALRQQQFHQQTPDNVSSDYYDLPPLLAVLPECCLYFGGTDKSQLQLAETTAQSHALVNALAELSKTYHCYLQAGSVPIWHAETKKMTNTSCLFSPEGNLLAQYDKIHLFDVDVNDSEKQYRESKYTQAGTQVVTAELPFANIGLTICYDLRFPELFRQLTVKGADIICVPAAFTQVTGEAHWLPLLQARAIENQVYIIAAGQQGTHENGRKTFGHSVIIDPWGTVLTQKTTGVGYITAPFDREFLSQVRQNIPVATHNQFTTKLNTLAADE